jgi:deoxyadenosine/deoxycytidine kinase
VDRERDRRFIVVDGPPGSGKTELARALAGALRARLSLEQTQNPFLGAKRDRRLAFAAQVHFLLDRWRRQAELAQETLLERGVVTDWHFDRDRLYAEVTLSPEELSLYENLFKLLEPRLPRPDLVVLIQASIPVLIRRLRGFTGNGIDEAFVRDVAEAYGNLSFRHAASPLLVVNTSEIDLGDPAVIADLVAVIRRHRGGVGHYKPLGSR